MPPPRKDATARLRELDDAFTEGFDEPDRA